MKNESHILDAVPSKRLYRSIIADYGINTSVSELIDNIIDARARKRLKRVVDVKLNVDVDFQTIELTDNSGGIQETELEKLVSPGSSHSDGKTESIGIFGVGSKRAAVALARNVEIKTRYGRLEKTFQIEYDEDWLRDDDWHLPVYVVSQIPQSTTQISLSKLRVVLDKENFSVLRHHLSITYANFIKNGDISLSLNGEELAPIFFDQWSFSPEAKPHAFSKVIQVDGVPNPIRIRITSGISYEPGSIGGNFGVYVYCNRRLVVSASRLPDFGFYKGVAGTVHPRMSLARIIIEYEGPADCMPWNSSKTGINFNHDLFRTVRQDILEAVRNATALSKRLQPDYDEMVEPFKSGEIVSRELKATEHIKASKLPPLPPIRKSPQNAIKEANREIGIQKPWTVAAYEGVIAVEAIKRQRTLSQKNRILLIVIDSTLEIAFKDYLAHEVVQPLSESRLVNLFGNRIDVHKEVAKTVATKKSKLWKSLDYYYKKRCELVHKRASVDVSDDEIATFQASAEKVLESMYFLKFPKG